MRRPAAHSPMRARPISSSASLNSRATARSGHTCSTRSWEVTRPGSSRSSLRSAVWSAGRATTSVTAAPPELLVGLLLDERVHQRLHPGKESIAQLRELRAEQREQGNHTKGEEIEDEARVPGDFAGLRMRDPTEYLVPIHLDQHSDECAHGEDHHQEENEPQQTLRVIWIA